LIESAIPFPIRALTKTSSVDLYNLLIQKQSDRLKSTELTAEQLTQLEGAFGGLPRRICKAANKRQQSEKKGRVYDEIIECLAQELANVPVLGPAVPAPIQAASVGVLAGALPVDGAFPAPSGKLLEFSAAAAFPRVGSALASSASPSAAASASVGPPRQHVMVSYAWDGAKERVVRFCDALRQHQIDVWRDETGSSLLGPMADAVNAHMAKAVELCSTMIVCVSRKYMVSISTFSCILFMNMGATSQIMGKLIDVQTFNARFVCTFADFVLVICHRLQARI
jgi:hypothetical protein